MTAKRILITILAEVLGRTPTEVEAILEACAVPVAHKEYSEAESERMLAALRREKPGILNWLIAGRTEAMTERPEYKAAVLEVIRQNAKLFRPGTVREITVAHDAWCRIFKDGPCDCDPVAMLVERGNPQDN